MNNIKYSFGILITAVFFVITQPLHAAAFNTDALDFHSAFIEGPVNPDESVILKGEFRTTSSTGVGDFVSAYIQLNLPTVEGDSSFYQLDNSATQQYQSTLEATLRTLTGNQSITLPIAKFDPIKPQESGGLSFEIDIVRLVVNGGLVFNPDGSISTSVSILPAGDLPASFNVDELSPSINHGLFIGAYDPGGFLSNVDFRVNAIKMSTAFGARLNTKVYTLTGDLSLDSNGNRVFPITNSKISNKLQSIRDSMHTGDSLTLYINNHGGSIKKDSSSSYDINSTGVGDEIIDVGKNATYDVIKNEDLLTDNKLADMLSQFNGFRVEVFLDSCHGGGFWGGSDSQEAVGFGYNDLNQLSNTALYSAAAEDKLSYSGYSSFSFWGKALLEAFKMPIQWHPAKLGDFLKERTLEIASNSIYIGWQESPVWYPHLLAFGDPVQPDMSLIETFVTSSVDFNMNAISLIGPDPLLQINTLTEAVANIGPGKSLINKMADVQAYYEMGDIVTACSTLNAFIKEVNAQAGKKVPADDAEQLIASAEFTMAAFECN